MSTAQEFDCSKDSYGRDRSIPSFSCGKRYYTPTSRLCEFRKNTLLTFHILIEDVGRGYCDLRGRLESCFYLCYCFFLDLDCLHVFLSSISASLGYVQLFPWFPSVFFQPLIPDFLKFSILSLEKLESLSPSRIYCFLLPLPRYPLLDIPSFSPLSQYSDDLPAPSLLPLPLSLSSPLPLPSSPQAPQSLPKPHFTTPPISRLPSSQINILILFLPLEVRKWS
jgi:hypothetical protein